MPENIKPIQKILFGSPGTGKSYQIREIARDKLGIPFEDTNRDTNRTVKTVFHPEYTYADFMGKLLPLTQGNSIIYKFYPGHFLRILGMAYQGLIERNQDPDGNQDPEGNQDHYLLVIDELNRGNAAAIFGTVFQLLDRDSNGWSSYEVDISEMELVGLLEAMNQEPSIDNNGVIYVKDGTGKKPYKDFFKEEEEKNKQGELYIPDNKSKVFSLLQQRRINIPPNLSILATINTSDESIYYLDSAFKRRWDWEYVKAPVRDASIPKELQDVKLMIEGDEKGAWSEYIVGINEWIKSNHQVIRRIEDKQIGWWFIKPEGDKVDLEQVKDKLMFYLWDSVFARDKRPIEKFLSDDPDPEKAVKLTAYSDFLDLTQKFMKKVGEFGK
jgi:5-methylcytosine-specific restriction endonuclease McrBC GTP-binding regulatory subunit McrB